MRLLHVLLCCAERTCRRGDVMQAGSLRPRLKIKRVVDHLSEVRLLGAVSALMARGMDWRRFRSDGFGPAQPGVRLKHHRSHVANRGYGLRRISAAAMAICAGSSAVSPSSMSHNAFCSTRPSVQPIARCRSKPSTSVSRSKRRSTARVTLPVATTSSHRLSSAGSSSKPGSPASGFGSIASHGWRCPARTLS
jgi:hypothetical protein